MDIFFKEFLPLLVIFLLFIFLSYLTYPNIIHGRSILSRMISTFGCTAILIGGSFYLHNNYNPNKYFAIYLVFYAVTIPLWFFLSEPLLFLMDSRNKIRLKNFEELLKRYGISKNITVFGVDIDSPNAIAVGGIYPLQFICLDKNFLTHLTEEESKAVFFHEYGHIKYWHILCFFLMESSILIFAIFLIGFLEEAFMGIHKQIITLIGLMAVNSLRFYVYGYIAIQFEHQADLYAARQIGKDHIISSLKKLNELTNGALEKGGWRHPNLHRRIAYVEQHS
jgi:Zn-dependent protease with chaperone function